MSVDFFATDWNRMSPEQLAAQIIERVERRKRGILLMHDIQERTALALPVILRELKRRGYRIVHVAPAASVHAQTETKAEPWAPVN
jgi:peptidoglycan/xylan/chitin deacetylase (PgdA/CDA1 family)